MVSLSRAIRAEGLMRPNQWESIGQTTAEEDSGGLQGCLSIQLRPDQHMHVRKLPEAGGKARERIRRNSA